MIDNQVRLDKFFFSPLNRTKLGLTGNSLWEELWNQGQYCDGVVYQYIAMIRHFFGPMFTRQPITH